MSSKNSKMTNLSSKLWQAPKPSSAPYIMLLYLSFLGAKVGTYPVSVPYSDPIYLR